MDETRRIINLLRSMANRTGNKAAEDAMREAADYFTAFEDQYVRMQGENDKLRTKISDMEAQIEGWKSLIDQYKQLQNVQAAVAATQDAPEMAQKPKPKRARYNYEGLLYEFMASEEKYKMYQAEARYKSDGGFTSIYPDPTQCNIIATRNSIPVRASQLRRYLVLERTDMNDDG